MFKPVEDIVPGDILFGGRVVYQVTKQVTSRGGERILIWVATLDGREPTRPSFGRAPGTKIEVEG